MNKDTEEGFPTNLVMYSVASEALFLATATTLRRKTRHDSHRPVFTLSYSSRLSGRWLSDDASAYKQAPPCNLANSFTPLTALRSTPLPALLQFLPPGFCVDFFPRDRQWSRQSITINLFSPSCFFFFGHGIYNSSRNQTRRVFYCASHLGSLRSVSCLGQKSETNHTSQVRTSAGILLCSLQSLNFYNREKSKLMLYKEWDVQ